VRPRPRFSIRQLPKSWAFQLLATGLFAFLAVWRVDLSQVANALQGANYLWAVAAVVFSTSTKFIDTVRWRVYLAKVGHPPLLGLFGAFLIGNLGNNLLPMRVGDMAKIQIVANRYGLSRAGLASSVFVVESVMDGVTFLILLVAGLAFLDVGFVPPGLLWSLAVMAGGGFLATMAVSHLFPRTPPRWRWLGRLPPRLQDGLREGWSRFLDGMETMRDKALLAQAVALNFAGWFSHVVVFWLFGLAFGLDLPLAYYIVIMVAANLVSAFPITFQNIGTYEFVLLEVMAAWGVERGEALAYAAATHLLTNLWIILVGITALWLMRVHPREVFGLRPAMGGSLSEGRRS
jgi:uncharacterized membrane protein YbhN (UPF0104 family)